MHTKTIYSSFLIIFLLLFQFSYAGEEKTYGNVIVNDVVSVYDGDTFKVNIEGYPPIVGEEISIRINGVDTPEKRGTSGYVKELAEKARRFAEHKLMGAVTIELRNMRRGKYFRIVVHTFVLTIVFLTIPQKTPYDATQCGLQYHQRCLAIPPKVPYDTT